MQREICALFVALIFVLVFTAPVYPADPSTVLDILLSNNKNFVSGIPNDPEDSRLQSIEYELGTGAMAVVLMCSDSLPDPRVFLSHNNIVVVRAGGAVIKTAGLVPDDPILGSIEFYPHVENTPLVIVLGEEKCRLAQAVIDGAEAKGSVGAVFAPIRIGITDATKAGVTGEVLATKATEANVKRTVDRIRGTRFIIGPLVDSGRLEVVGAMFDRETQSVRIIYRPDHKATGGE
ncbi:MAG: carbonic anhydrase [Candidatus Paceibacterota bacterium]|jgi:carbonic anhydrase